MNSRQSIEPMEVKAMTDKEFDTKVEKIAAQLEEWIEVSADKFDKRVTRKYNESRLFRFAARGFSIAIETGLLLCTKPLIRRGHKTAAIWCFLLAAGGLAAELLRIFIWGRRK